MQEAQTNFRTDGVQGFALCSTGWDLIAPLTTEVRTARWQYGGTSPALATTRDILAVTSVTRLENLQHCWRNQGPVVCRWWGYEKCSALYLHAPDI